MYSHACTLNMFVLCFTIYIKLANISHQLLATVHARQSKAVAVKLLRLLN